MTIFDKLREKYGSHEKAARVLGISSKTYFNWKKRGVIAPQWLALIEKMCAEDDYEYIICTPRMAGKIHRRRAELTEWLKVARAKREDLATPEEKREKLDKEIADLEKALKL